jgi:hypothetical protein
VEGYTEIMLSDAFCSGVPLSTLDFDGDYTYRAGSTTAQIYQSALAKFDTALTLARDSARIVNLARVGRGRAYLALGRYDSAAVAVTGVSSDFVYNVMMQWTTNHSINELTNRATMANLEGRNGLPYLDGDVRTLPDTIGFSDNGSMTPETFPHKYQIGGYSPVPLASGIEASLIRAEALIHGSGGAHSAAIDTLNTLRATIGLSPLADPGSDSARVRLLFEERARWLFLTGHRQGDLRRLIRQYGASYPQFKRQDQVFPTGAYVRPNLRASQYGADVNIPIPSTETPNPLFHGCLDRSA